MLLNFECATVSRREKSTKLHKSSNNNNGTNERKQRMSEVRPRFGAEIRDSNLAFEFPPNSGAHFLCTFAFFERELALFRK